MSMANLLLNLKSLMNLMVAMNKVPPTAYP